MPLFAQNFSIELVRAVNLVNDKGNKASNEDQIILFLGTYSFQNEILLNWSRSDILYLQDTLPLSIPNCNIPINDLSRDDLIILLAVEVKNPKKALAIEQIIKQNLIQYINFPRNLLFEKIRYALQDNLLIHVNLFSIDELLELDKLYQIKGMSLLNKFEYELKLNF